MDFLFLCFTCSEKFPRKFSLSSSQANPYIKRPIGLWGDFVISIRHHDLCQFRQINRFMTLWSLLWPLQFFSKLLQGSKNSSGRGDIECKRFQSPQRELQSKKLLIRSMTLMIHTWFCRSAWRLSGKDLFICALGTATLSAPFSSTKWWPDGFY